VNGTLIYTRVRLFAAWWADAAGREWRLRELRSEGSLHLNVSHSPSSEARSLNEAKVLISMFQDTHTAERVFGVGSPVVDGAYILPGILM
jgi:hypothetical protein